MAKISKLCMNCPNWNENWPGEGEGNCKGYYYWDDEGACRTFRSWRGGKLSLREAIEAKKRQHKRHQRTDGFRKEIQSKILEYQGGPQDGFMRKRAEDMATRIAKGENAFSVFKEATNRNNFYLPKKLSIAIEEKRQRYVC